MIRLLIVYFALTVASSAQQVNSGRLDILQGGADDGFLRAINAREFNFPADHGPHAGYRHEWWYATGNLDGPEGRQFGYELTFFRFALEPEAKVDKTASPWTTPVVFAAHFAITDIDGEDFKFFQRYARGDGRLAGARTDKVWLEDWSFENDGDQWKLIARDGDISLTLDMTVIKPPVLQGEGGLSRKSAAPGNASYYYTLPRMQSSGSIEIGGETYPVTGLTWLDREWGTSALSADQQGWDWFALHLSDGSDLMFYNLRAVDGTRHPFSAGSWIDAAGNKTSLDADSVEVEISDYWDSPLGGRYPSGWKVALPAKGLEITVTPMLKNQELNTMPRYWEGAVTISGISKGANITGRGYVELTGYSK